MKLAGRVARIGRWKIRTKIWLEIMTGTDQPLGAPRCRWKDNIKMYIEEMMCEGADWVHLAQDRDRW
jgi:hypothetical protein